MCVLSTNQCYSLLQNLLHVLSREMKPEISTGLTKKYPSENPHQINNTEGWYQNAQFGGSGLNPC